MSEHEELARTLGRKAAVQIHIRDTTFDFLAWTDALINNRTLEDVTISVSVVSLATCPTVLRFFEAIGRLAKLRQLCFTRGMYCWKFPVRLLTRTLSQLPQPAHLHTLHLQDVEFRGYHEEQDGGIALLAHSLSSLNGSLKTFSMAHCRLEVETTKPILDPVKESLFMMNGLETIVISATRLSALGGPISLPTLRRIFARHRPPPPPHHHHHHHHHHQTQQQHLHSFSAIKELRLLKFDFSTDVLVALLGTLIVHYHRHLEKLLLSSCQWNAATVRVVAQLLHNCHHLREVHLLGNCDFLLLHESSREQQQQQQCHEELAAALQQSTSMRRFFVEPLYKRQPPKSTYGRTVAGEDEMGIPIACQKIYVEQMENNYALEEFRMVDSFAPKWQALMEFYLRLNRAGRRTVCFPTTVQQNDNTNDNDIDDSWQVVGEARRSNINRLEESDKETWINAITAVNDDVACIFYFLVRNPSLCS